jgi:proline iminopeptidase
VTTEERALVNGVSLYTRTIGDGPQTIVLHGGPGAHHDYLLPQFDLLAAGRRLRYYDQRGGGRSPVGRNVPVGWREQVADLDALITHWDASPATLLGYSWGGLLAMLYAVRHPGRVGRLALVSPAATTTAGRSEFERRFAERANDPRIAEERRRLAASGLRQRDPDAHRQRVFELAVAPYFHDPVRARDLTPFRVTGRTQDEVWRSLGDYDLTAELERLSVPALVAHGRDDPIPLESAEDTARRLQATLVVFEQSGHVPYVEETERFVAVLDAFLPRAP